MDHVNLSRSQEALLDGAAGEIPKKAMALLVTLGKMLGARKMIRISSAQVSGVSYLTIGDAGLDFLTEWSGSGASAKVKTTTNPAGMDQSRWREMNVPEEFAAKQIKVMDCFDRMKVCPSYTCVPYLSGNRPRYGEHVSWAESSAVVFANSVLGARTNRESGMSALASAITGFTPAHGLHLSAERRPTCDVRINQEEMNELECSALGYLIAQKIQTGIPNLVKSRVMNVDKLKALGASLGAAGAIPMFTQMKRSPKREMITVSNEDIQNVIRELSRENKSEHVCLGCPHLSLGELKHIAELLKGKKTKKHLWCFTARPIRDHAKRLGYVDCIEKAGGKVFCDTCMVVSPMREMGVEGTLTNSCKAAHYLPSLSKVEPTLRNLEECIHLAAT